VAVSVFDAVIADCWVFDIYIGEIRFIDEQEKNIQRFPVPV
jgi:hypothetical protein